MQKEAEGGGGRSPANKGASSPSKTKNPAIAELEGLKSPEADGLARGRYSRKSTHFAEFIFYISKIIIMLLLTFILGLL